MAKIDDVTPGSYIFDWLDDTLLPMLSGSVSGFMQIISPVMGAAVILWFVIWAWKYIREEQPITDLLWRFFILSAVCFFAFTAPYYTSTIIPMVNNIPFDLSKPFISGGSDGAGLVNTADSLLSDNFELIEKLWEDAQFGIWEFDVDNFAQILFASLIILILGTIYAATGLFFIIIAKLMVNVILAIGPAFIVAAFFPATRNYFNLWLNQLINYILLATLIAIIFSIQLTLISDLAGLDDGKLPVGRTGKMMVVYLIGIATLLGVPTIASSLSGGMGLNGMVGGVGQAAGAIARPGAAAARFAGRLGGGKLPGGNNIKPNRAG